MRRMCTCAYADALRAAICPAGTADRRFARQLPHAGRDDDTRAYSYCDRRLTHTMHQ